MAHARRDAGLVVAVLVDNDIDDIDIDIDDIDKEEDERIMICFNLS